MLKAGLFVATVLSLWSSAAFAQCRGAQPATAVRARTPIQFDGRLDDPVWREAPALNQFYEYFPANCGTPTEQSEARFAYDDHYLYVAFRARLRDRSQLRAPFVRRDKVGSSHDYMQVYLDPLGSKRTSYIFRVNARGTKTEGLQDEAKQSESTDPDFDWDVRTHIDSDGWTAELRIPLTTLRLARHGPQQWFVLVTRGVPRDQNTQMATAPFSRNSYGSGCFLCYASTLTFADLDPHTERLLVTPSLVLRRTSQSGSYGSGSHLRADPSLDAKWLPYSGASVDLTIRPDFSQVEADSPVLTANQRFAINLPEKRPFFRDGSDLLGTPIPVIYTRTITAPDVGLRFTHRSAELNGTVFVAKDGGRGAIVEPGLRSSSLVFPDFASTVAFAHAVDGLGKAQIGALAAAKVNDDGSRNIIGGADVAWNAPGTRLVGQVIYSATRDPNRPDLFPGWHGQSLDGIAAMGEWDHSGTVNSQLRVSHYDTGFRSWLGYVPRVGYDSIHAQVQRPFYFSNPLFKSLSPYAGIDALAANGGHGHEADPFVGVSWSGFRSLGVDVRAHPSSTVLNLTGQERTVGYVEWTASINPMPRIPLVKLNGLVGKQVDFVVGDVVPAWTTDAAIRARPLDNLEIEGRLTLNRLDGGRRLSETIKEALLTWYFGPAFYALADVQFYSSQRNLGRPFRSSLLSVQVSKEISAATQLFFGVRSGANRAPLNTSENRSTELYVKLSRRFGL